MAECHWENLIKSSDCVGPRRSYGIKGVIPLIFFCGRTQRVKLKEEELLCWMKGQLQPQRGDP